MSSTMGWMKKLAWTGLLLALVLGAASCQSVRELATEYDPWDKPEQVAYQNAIKPYEATLSIHQGPATELLGTALPLNETVRKAMVQRRMEAFKLDEDESRQEFDDQMEAAKNQYQVLFSIYVPEKKWNDLAAQDTNWKIFLVNPRGQRLAPIDRRLIKRRSAINQALYPFWGYWKKLYIFSFAKQTADGQAFLAPGENTTKFILTGAPGQDQVELSWD